MSSLQVLYGDWKLIIILLSLFIVSYIFGKILYVSNINLALNIIEKLDTPRKKIVKIICKNLFMPYGVIRIIFIIFVVNLFGGAFIWSSIGGVLLVIPFIHNIMTGTLTGILLKRYPERVNWVTFFNIVFEIGAFICAAIGGIRIGLSILGYGNVLSSIVSWSMIFFTVVIPLQFVGAIFEGFLFKILYIEKNISLPYGLVKKDL